jgi:uncharacterized protein YjiS (DUF1127 family)
MAKAITEIQEARNFPALLADLMHPAAGGRRPVQRVWAKVKSILLSPCILGLAAPQHRNFCTAESKLYSFQRRGRHQRLNRNCKEITMLLSLIRMVQAFRDYQRNVSELSQLSDRELADIGLDRADIPRVAAGTYAN